MRARDAASRRQRRAATAPRRVRAGDGGDARRPPRAARSVGRAGIDEAARRAAARPARAPDRPARAARRSARRAPPARAPRPRAAGRRARPRSDRSARARPPNARSGAAATSPSRIQRCRRTARAAAAAARRPPRPRRSTTASPSAASAERAAAAAPPDSDRGRQRAGEERRARRAAAPATHRRQSRPPTPARRGQRRNHAELFVGARKKLRVSRKKLSHASTKLFSALHDNQTHEKSRAHHRPGGVVLVALTWAAIATRAAAGDAAAPPPLLCRGRAGLGGGGAGRAAAAVVARAARHRRAGGAGAARAGVAGRRPRTPTMSIATCGTASVQRAGINPYRFAPDAPRAGARCATTAGRRINNRALPTIYPPLARGGVRGRADARRVEGLVALADLGRSALLLYMGLADRRRVARVGAGRRWW